MREQNASPIRRIGELLLPAIVLAVLLFYSYVRFYGISYIGFQYNGTTGEVAEVHVPPGAPSGLAEGDRILAINGQQWDRVFSPHRANPLPLAQPGEVLTLSIEGQSEPRTVNWTVPGFNMGEFISRLINTWLASYIFWLAGTATLLLLRPKDERWALMVAFNYITAIWLLAGTISYSGAAASGFVLRAGVWMSLPIYLHLHWNLPRPLGRIPQRAWLVFYAAAALLFLGQGMGWLSQASHLYVFMAAVLGSVSLLGYRYLARPGERGEIGLLFFAVAVAVTPPLALALASVRADVSTTAPGYVLSMLALPGAYFYVVYRRQLGDLEFRANRLISIYLFIVVLVTLALLILPLLSSVFSGLSDASGAIILTAMFVTLLSIYGFERFQGFVERRLLHIPVPPRALLEKFAGRISTSFLRSHLVETLTKETLPTFLIRQSALIDLEAPDTSDAVVYLQAATRADLPTAREQQTLARLTRPFQLVEPAKQGSAWVRVALPLRVSGEPRWLWLLGRKDPDDHYSHEELNLLRSLGDQMAIALVNIAQAQRLRALYQADIERQETERVHLARELHDDTLQRINELGMLVDDAQYNDGFGKKLAGLVAQVRGLMNSLRPPLLDQGLYYALQDLSDEFAQKPYAKVLVRFEMELSNARLDHRVEQHIYRIAQQACENVLQHSKAKHLTFRGQITSEGIDLIVEDDGMGFKLNDPTSLTEFLSTRHFGLAGMQERAAMIGANLQVQSAPGKGTQVRLAWKKNADMELLKS
ncbi:MAG: ATP-binding protein [Anaerolineales bacterium]